MGHRRGVHPRSQGGLHRAQGDRRRRGEESPDGGRSLRGAPLRRPRLLPHHLHRGEAQEGVQEHLRRGRARAFLLHRHQGRARSHRRQEGGRRPRHRPPRDPLHPRGGARRAPGYRLAPRDVRAGPRVRADVPAVSRHQELRLQDGALRRGRGRALRRLPLLPQGSLRRGVPQGVRQEDHPPAPVGRPSREQVHHGVGHRGSHPAFVPAGVRLRHEHRPGAEDDPHERDGRGRAPVSREVPPPQGFRHPRPALPPRRGALAPEGAVLRRRRLRLGRRPPGLRQQDGERRAIRQPRAEVPPQPSHHQGVLPPSRDLRGALRHRNGERRLRVRHLPLR